MEYHALLMAKVRTKLKWLYILGTCFIVAIAMNKLCDIYLNHTKHVNLQVSQALRMVKELNSKNELMKETIREFKSLAFSAKQKEQVVTKLYKALDEISHQAKSFNIEYKPIKTEDRMSSLPLEIKGKAKSLEAAQMLLTYLASLEYPFFKINGVDLRYQKDEVEVSINGELIIYILQPEDSHESSRI